MLKKTQDTVDTLEVTNGLITLKFYKSGSNQGTYEIRYRNNNDTECLIKDCYSNINYYENGTKYLLNSTSKECSFNSQVNPIENDLGKGLQIIFNGKDITDQAFSFAIQFTLYEKRDFILVKVIDIKDLNKNPEFIHSIAPLTIENSPLYLTGEKAGTNLKNISWFKHGWQSWSVCKVLFGNKKDNKGAPIKIGRRVLDNQDYTIRGRFYSEYCTVVTDLESRNSLVMGFITFRDQFTRIILDYKSKNKIKLLTAFGCMDGVNLLDSSIDTSEELFISFQEKNLAYYGLINYAKVVKSYITEKRITDVPIGWCSWYLYYTKITEDEMISNLEIFKKNKEDLPINFIQLDDGYQKAIGDYNIINEKFPNGLYWLFDKIKTAGYNAGIWTGPFFAVEKSELFENHPDWFITRITSKKNKLLKATYNWGAWLHGLDLTNQEVLDYLKDFFRRLTFAFESEAVAPVIDFFKIDFLHAAVPFDGKFRDHTYTRAQMCYNGVKAIRDGIKDESFLLGCGAPLGPCVGLVDAMRIGTDTAPHWKIPIIDGIGEKYGFAAPSLKRGMLPALQRSFMHKYFWINDPDCLMIRREDTKLNYEEIKLQITVFGLSGGQVLISDNMAKLSEEEISDAKLVIPPFNPINTDPIPSDMFYSRYPSIYMLETNEAIGKRYLCAIINWEDKNRIRNTTVSEIVPNLPSEEGLFLIFDFWNETPLGMFKKDEILPIGELFPHSCRYLTIIPLSETALIEPIFISSTIHITQGSCEVKKFKFLKDQGKILIDLDIIGRRKGYLYIKLPKDKKISKCEMNYSQFEEKNNIWKVSVEFKDKISMEINLD